MKKDDLERLNKGLERIMDQTYSDFGNIVFSCGATYSKAQAFAIYALLNGATDCGAHVQYHSGRKNDISSLMVWDNNIVFTCKNEKSNTLLFNWLGKMLENKSLRGCGWKHSKRFGRSVANEDKQIFNDIIVAFHSFKGDVKRIKQSKNSKIPYI